MLNLTAEQKKVFYLSGYFNDYILTFPNINLTIDNEILHSETPVIQESICDEEDLILGGCIASSMQFTVSEIIADQISGLEFTATINVSNEDGDNVLKVPMGTFRVDSAIRADDKDYKQVTAYDRLYDASVDVSGWYNAYFSGGAMHTVKQIRESLLEYLGIPFVSQTLPNDDMTVSKTLEPAEGSLPGTTVLKALCTVNGGFGRMNRQGEFEVVNLKGLGLFPEDSQGTEDNVYPSETLYPEDTFEYLGISDEENEYPEYRSVIYEEYMTQPITCLNIQTDEEDVGVTIGADTSNPYIITANFLLYGKTVEDLEFIGENILDQISGITYRPNTTELNGLPYLECGDVFALLKRTDTVESFIFSRTLSGIQGLIDTYEAKGNEIRANEVSANEEIQQLKGKTLKIIKQVDQFAVQLEDLEEDAQSLLEMSATNILLQVTKDGKVVAMTLNAEENETSFSIEADNINFDGKTFNLTTEKMNIESLYFSIDEEGNVTAKAINIEGGTINIETGYDDDNKISLNFQNLGERGVYDYKNISMDGDGFHHKSYYYRDNSDLWDSDKGVNDTWEHGEYSIDTVGYGEPLNSEAYNCGRGTTYLDKDTGKLYAVIVSGDDYPSNYHWVYIYQCTLIDYYEEGDYVDVDIGGIKFSKVEEQKGEVEELEASILVETPETEDPLLPKKLNLRANVPLYMPNIQAGYVNITPELSRTPAFEDVDFSTEFQAVPHVVVTPVTSVPGTGVLGVGVSNISTSGFRVYLTRNDTTTTSVQWIAIES